ncbi:hypothetical protein M426DRAFT_247936 [Hypoxylon sp. CI-4A]|nr:hypothetical protein M426DRAFT_247936 [Hypoxylon sp. CI-4A]
MSQHLCVRLSGFFDRTFSQVTVAGSPRLQWVTSLKMEYRAQTSYDQFFNLVQYIISRAPRLRVIHIQLLPSIMAETRSSAHQLPNGTFPQWCSLLDLVKDLGILRISGIFSEGLYTKFEEYKREHEARVKVEHIQLENDRAPSQSGRIPVISFLPALPPDRRYVRGYV